MSENKANSNALTVEIDRSPEIEKERSEKAQLKEELDAFKRAEFERKKANLPFKYQSLATEASISTLEQLAKQEKNGANANGSVPITHTEGGKFIKGYEVEDESLEMRRSFSTYGEMAQHLIKQAHENPDGAEHVALNKLMARTINEMNQKPVCYTLDSSIADFMAGKGKFKLKQPSDSQTEDAEMLA